MSEHVDLIQEVLEKSRVIGEDIESGRLEVYVIARTCEACRLADLEPDAAATSGVIGGFEG